MKVAQKVGKNSGVGRKWKAQGQREQRKNGNQRRFRKKETAENERKCFENQEECAMIKLRVFMCGSMQ